ncbi:MAG: type IV pilin-like G/H family protein [Synechococcales cyanobacterium T60_A2020_003]|nr:type IV pilin-like G/H family protein [Synechococcales cyanobacterium T60_A2020_003]
MKTDLKAKFLQHLVRKNSDKGFTLIELLVVIIIIGILSAIALPSFLNQTSKARASEAKNQIGAINRGEQAYYMENGAFTSDIDALGLGLKTNGKNYGYTLDAPDGESLQTTTAKNNFDRTKGYSGGVSVDTNAVMRTIICESEDYLDKDGELGAPEGEGADLACTEGKPLGEEE